MNIKSTRTRLTTFLLAAAAVVALLLTISVVPEPASAQDAEISVAIPNTSVALGRTVTASIKVEPGTSELGALMVEVNYDPEFFVFSSCGGDFRYFACNDDGEDSVLLATVTGTEWKNAFALGTVTFEAIKLVEASSAAITVKESYTNQAEVPSDSTTDGSLNVSSLGDVNCDGSRTMLDALLTAQAAIDLRTDAATCPLGDAATTLNAQPGDSNGDSSVTMIDALLTAQCAIDINNVSCPAS